MNLSKSSYCRGIQCKKMLWLEKHKPEEKEEINNDRILEQGNDIHEVARYLFGSHINIEYRENLSQMIEDTINTIDSYKDVIITEASFTYKNNFCSVDILKKNNNTYEIYEVKSSTELKDIYINDASYQYYVLNNLGLKVTKVCLVHINSDYTRIGDLDLDQLFIKQDITKEVLELQEEVKQNIKEINEYVEEKEKIEEISENCFKPYPCPFFKYCTKHLPEKNIFDIPRMQTRQKLKLYNKGVYSYEELLKEDINENTKKIIEYELYNKEDYIDKSEIKNFLNTLKEPLYFLDFETYQMPIPLYDYVSPYEQIPFQYSLHYIKKELKHKEFLAESGIDPRRSLAEQLVKDIPKDVTTLAYNMTFEKGVIKKLSNLYPDLKDHLMNIHNNIKDLMIPFQKGHYYKKEMHGSYSIKYVLPALFPDDPSLNYKNLDLIHNGGEAMASFQELINKPIEEQNYIRERLLRYCELDTYAMVKIYEKLLEVVKE